jgi:hypothetical protein
MSIGYKNKMIRIVMMMRTYEWAMGSWTCRCVLGYFSVCRFYGYNFKSTSNKVVIIEIES